MATQKDAGIPRKTNAEYAEIYQRWKEFMLVNSSTSARRMAVKFGVSEGLIYKWLKQKR